ncbi:MAG: DnaJ domain-containing protein [Pseudomonadota bacterium]
MVALKNEWTEPFSADDVGTVERVCDHPGCNAEGVYRAPKSRTELKDYYWFCLDHVRAYNKAWNYYEGLSDDEVERSLRADTVWQRRTKPLGSWRAREHWLREKVARDFDPDGAGSREEHTAHSSPRHSYGSDFDRALAVLGLKAPVDWVIVKIQYKQLVKRHHPDANGGDKDAEERLKAINHAYGILKAALSD